MDRWTLITGFIDYLDDQNLEPHVTIDTRRAGDTGVPAVAIRPDGRVTLNLAERAAVNLVISEEGVSCAMRFNGEHRDVQFPIESIEALHAPSNGTHMVFPKGEPNEPKPADTRPKLRVVH